MKTLELFNAVKASNKNGEYKILPEYGIIVEPSASHELDRIKSFYKNKLLTGEQLNATFHKSWKKIMESSREELYLHQIMHYLTTYGTGHTSEFIYMPDENLDVPQVTTNFLVVRGLTEDELVEKSLDMFKSGVALTQETILDVLEVLDNCDYTFTGDEDVKNKEALMYICQEAGVVPSDPVEAVRYLYFIATGETLLIKNAYTYDKIKHETTPTNRKLFNNALKKVNERKLAEVFNRFKPIILSFKDITNEAGRKKINKISKLSKALHKPIPYNILNNVGSCTLKALKDQEENLINANFFQLARCLNFLKKSSGANYNMYTIRNGKAYVQENTSTPKSVESKIKFLLKVIKKKFDLKGKTFYIPEDVKYALPTSEKNFVGNIPMGTKLVSNDPIASGVYWENRGGARDIDISALSITGKVGWNSAYHGEVTYSGDITSAPNGATEYIRANTNMQNPHLINSNIFSGQEKGSKFKIIFGKGSKVSKDYMMNPNKVWFCADAETLDRQSIVGLMQREGKKYSATVLNVTTGTSMVSHGGVSDMFREALVDKYKNVFYLNDLLEACGAKIVEDAEDAEFNLTPSKLERDSITKIFT